MKKRTTQFETREQYLRRAATIINQKILKPKAEVELPETWFVSVMEPAGKVIGRAWPASHDAHHMFVSATMEDPVQVLGTLAHEMIHLAVGVQEKHNKVFGAAARAIGLEGKLTATHPGEELAVELKKIDELLAGYPHKPLNVKLKEKQSGPAVRRKFVSVNDPSYSLYISLGRVDEWGPPKDPNGDDMEME